MFLAMERIGALVQAHGQISGATVLKDGRVEDRSFDLMDALAVLSRPAPGWLSDQGIRPFPYDETLYGAVQEELFRWAFSLTPGVMVLSPHRFLLKDPEPWREGLLSAGEAVRFAESEVPLYAKGFLVHGRRIRRQQVGERMGGEVRELPLQLLEDRFSRLKALSRLGIETFGAAWDLPAGELSRKLGGGGEALLRYLRGEASIFIPEPPPATFEVGLSLEGVGGAGDLLSVTFEGARELGRDLQRENLSARCLSWSLEGPGWKREGEVRLLRPSADPLRLGSVLGRDMGGKGWPQEAERLLLRVSALGPGTSLGQGLFGGGTAPKLPPPRPLSRREERLALFDPMRGGKSACRDSSVVP